MKHFFSFSIVFFLLSILIVAGGYWFINKPHSSVALEIPVRQGELDIVHEQSMPRAAGWFSGFYTFPSFPVFAFPGAYKISAQGLEVSFPQVSTNEKLIAAAFVPTCRVHTTSPIQRSKVTSYGDFHVNLELSTQNGPWNVTFMQGSPVVYIHTPELLSFTCMSPTTTEGTLSVTAMGDKRIGIEQGSQNIEGIYTYRIILFPREGNAFPTAYAQNLPWAEPIGTSTDFAIDSQHQKITTTLSVTTDSGESSLLTTWPHQGIDTASPDSYTTVLGNLGAIQGNTLVTTVPLPELPLLFPKVVDQKSQAQIKQAINQDAVKFLSETPPAGVYFKGTWIGGLTSLIQLADLYGEDQIQEQLLTKLETVLLPTLSDFHYDPEKFLWVANTPEFGNEKGNDHHFHYGYYIRAAAVLAHFKPTQLETMHPSIEEMIADIASIERNERYPRLRVFSPYEGHSWASGDAAFADGNNQESTSEALNAWYAIKIWGDVTKNQSVSDRGLWLFSQELAATRSYWFGINNSFPAGYGRSLASLVWGGKREFATWFSADPMHVYGIQWLPITPAYRYLQTDMSPAWFEELQRLGANPTTHEWGDLYTAVLSLTDPKAAAAIAPGIQTTKGMYIHSLLLQTVYSNLEEK